MQYKGRSAPAHQSTLALPDTATCACAFLSGAVALSEAISRIQLGVKGLTRAEEHSNYLREHQRERERERRKKNQPQRWLSSALVQPENTELETTRYNLELGKGARMEWNGRAARHEGLKCKLILSTMKTARTLFDNVYNVSVSADDFAGTNDVGVNRREARASARASHMSGRWCAGLCGEHSPKAPLLLTTDKGLKPHKTET